MKKLISTTTVNTTQANSDAKPSLQAFRALCDENARRAQAENEAYAARPDVQESFRTLYFDGSHGEHYSKALATLTHEWQTLSALKVSISAATGIEPECVWTALAELISTGLVEKKLVTPLSVNIDVKLLKYTFRLVTKL
jgi:transposase